jgi:hypothetical protein
MNLTSVSIDSSWRPPEEADPERPWGGHYRDLNYVPARGKRGAAE